MGTFIFTNDWLIESFYYYFLGYYVINVQIYGTNPDYAIYIDGGQVTRNRDGAPTDSTASGQLIYKLNVGQTVQIRAVGSYNVWGELNPMTYFQMLLLYPE